MSHHEQVSFIYKTNYVQTYVIQKYAFLGFSMHRNTCLSFTCLKNFLSNLEILLSNLKQINVSITLQISDGPVTLVLWWPWPVCCAPPSGQP